MRQMQNLGSFTLPCRFIPAPGGIIMTRHKWNLHAAAAVVMVLAIGGGCWCAPEKICGDVCCPENSVCDAQTNQCTACGLDEDVCGNTCCAVGESCVAGTACCPDARICGDVCCPQGTWCDSQTNQCMTCPNPTDTACNVGGCCPAGKVCTDAEGICCDPGETCCDVVCSGGCKPINQCIS